MKKTLQGIKNDKLLFLYKKMLQIRMLEERLFLLFSTRPMPGTMHQYNGEEAIAVGVCANLNDNDYITSTHRGHGHCVAKGVDLKAIMAEMFAKSTGCCKGMGGSMHIADYSVGMLGANGIVGAGIPIATGAGLTCKFKKEKQVTVSFFGDGASNKGEFHEAINMAAIWGLPVLFICENNLYGYSVHYKRTMLLDNIAERATSYGIPGIIADGMDVLEVYNKSAQAIERARNGQGPTLIECKTYRFMGHARFEKPNYRSKEELEEFKKRDPIIIYKNKLLNEYEIDIAEISNIDKLVKNEIDEAVNFAENSPDPEPLDYLKYLFA